MSLTSRLRATGAIVLGAAVLAGCGGSDDGGGGGKLSAQEFKDKANAACKKANDRLEKLKKPTDMASAATFARDAEPIARDLADDLDALQPPDSEKAKVDKMRSALRSGVKKIAKLRKAAEANDIAQIRQVSSELSASDVDKQAAQLGLGECGKNVEPSG